MFAHLTGVQATPSSRARLTPMLAASGNRTMSIETARDILLWCTVINDAVLLLWFLCFSLATIGFIDSTHDGFGCLLISSTPSITQDWRFTR